MIIWYLVIIALFEVMVYMAIKIAYALFILVDSPVEDNVQYKEISSEEFENMMKELFGDKDD